MVYGIIEEKSREDAMDFKELTYVLAIARHQNITRAAEALHLTQPTLSKFLKALETELHQPLFQRLGNRYQPTYAGERYLQRAREILEAKRALDQEMGDIIKNNEGYLKIGFPTMRGTYMLPVTLPIFHDRYPNVRIDVHEANSEHLVKLLLDGELDAFFTPARPDSAFFQCLELYQNPIMLGAAEKTPIAQKGSISIGDILDLPLAFFNAPMPIEAILNACFQTLGKTPNVVLRTSDQLLLRELTMQGQIYPILPLDMMGTWQNIRQIPLDFFHQQPYGLGRCALP